MSLLSAAVVATGQPDVPTRNRSFAHAFWRILDSGNLSAVPARRPKSSLAAASLACINRLHGIGNSGIAKPVDLISIYNNAALLFYHNGRLDWASDVTVDALRLCSAGWKKTGDVTWQACMLQPYVNLGRLASARRDFPAAMSFFEKVYRYVWEAQPFCIGESLFVPALLDHFRNLKNEGLKLDAFSAAVYIADGGRTFLFRKAFDGLLDFLGRVEKRLGLLDSDPHEQNPGSLECANASLNADDRSAAIMVISELQARAFAGRGQDQKALAIYSTMVKRLPRMRPGMVAIYAVAAALLLEMGRRDDARRLLEYGADILKSFALEPSVELEHYQAQFALALQHSSLGNLERAESGAGTALQFATSCNHEVGTLRARVLLLLSRHGEQRENVPSEDFNNCLEEAERCSYPLERACALFELAQIWPNDSAEQTRLKQRGQAILKHLKLTGGCVPEELLLNVESAPPSVDVPVSAGCIQPPIGELYQCLRAYAFRNADRDFSLCEMGHS